jgi:hypothetical protein
MVLFCCAPHTCFDVHHDGASQGAQAALAPPVSPPSSTSSTVPHKIHKSSRRIGFFQWLGLRRPVGGGGGGGWVVRRNLQLRPANPQVVLRSHKREDGVSTAAGNTSTRIQQCQHCARSMKATQQLGGKQLAGVCVCV